MSIISSTRDKITRYIETNLSLIKLGVVSRTSVLLSYLMLSLIILFVFFCIILFVGFGITQLFISAGVSYVLAYFLTTCVYLLLLAVVVLLRKNIAGAFTNIFVQVLTEPDNDDDDEKNPNESSANPMP